MNVRGRRRTALAVLVASLVAASCAGADTDADTDSDTAMAVSATTVPVDESTPAPTSQPVDIGSGGAEPDVTTAGPDAGESRELGELGLLSPGAYTSDMLSLELELTTTADFRVTSADPGRIIIESLGSSDSAFTAVAFLVADTLIDSDVLGRHRARFPAAISLGEFLESRDRVEVIDRREDDLGGLPADVWRLGYTEPCDDCWFEVLFNTTGWQNQMGIAPGYVHEIWAIDAPDSPIIVMVEAPEESFDSWRDDVRTHLFDQLEFGSPTGYSLHRPTGEAFADGFGEHAIGRAELVVDDTSRSTIEVDNDIGLVVPASDERQILLSVAYPSVEGGFGSAPADGSFPLVVVAPALGDAAIVLPAERQLASHGFVVVTVRFPESSFPGGAVFGVPQQPADVSFVIDELQRGVLPADLSAVTDTERIGLVGQSGGATTGFGLLSYDCCQDDRIDAVVAHGGTPFDFNSTQVGSVAPILHVASSTDATVPIGALREFHATTAGASSLAVLDDVEHLAWLAPNAPEYDDSFDLVLAFLGQQLRGASVDPADVAVNSVFVEFDSR